MSLKDGGASWGSPNINFWSIDAGDENDQTNCMEYADIGVASGR
jgi:hypothetical protein